MSRCPQCHAELPDVDAGQDRCPHCDALLPTPSSVRSRTVDSVDALSPGDASASQQADEGGSEACGAARGADSSRQPASESHRPSDTAGDVVQTLDSVERPPAPSGVSDAKGDAGDACRTVDSVDKPAVLTSHANSGVTEHEIVRTLVSREPCVEPKGPADFADGITATFDVAAERPGNASRRSDDGHGAPPRDLAADEAEMARLWGGVSGEPPNVTIKTQQPLDVDHSAPTLVIQERAMGRASHDVVRSLDYDLADRLGEGGMGTVYLARQSSLDRPVAVKVLKPHLLEDESQRVKFLSEAVVTGELEHPGIIPIYDLGRDQDGTLFYSMKRVQGDAWSKVIRRKSLAENLEILMKVCDAIAFAHSRDVIHRDLKPDNIMIGEFGEVLVLDWGLAVTVSDDPASANVARIKTMGGTPAYMAPEMATGPASKIGKHSDIYLLGAILYECITGKLPRRFANVTSCLAAAGRNEIEPTEEKGELVDVARHAMAKEPADRYPSVQALQAAIREYLSHAESITLATRAAGDLDAARASNDYRDFARALFGFEESLQLWPANSRAQGGIREARLAYATSAYHKGDYDLGLSLLQADTPDHVELRGKMKAAQEERQARAQRLRTARRVVLTLAALVFLAVATGTVLVWLAKREADFQRDVARKNEIEARHQKTKANQNEQLAIGQKRIAEQQRQVAVENEQEADRQRQAALRNEQEAVRQREKAEYEAYVALIGLAAAKIDERAFRQAAALLEQCQPDLRNWEWGRLMHLCRPRNVELLDAGHRVECVAFDSTGTRVAAAGLDGIARVWDVRTGELSGQVRLESPGAQVLAVAISPANANLLALGSTVEGCVLRVCDLATSEQRVLAGHTAEVVSVEFSKDGKHLLSASKDHTAALWDVSTGELVRQLRGHHWWVWDASFSPDENLIVTASEDGTARIWDRETGQQWMSERGEPMPFTGHRGAVFAAAFSPDGQHVATGGFDRRVLLWNPAELRPFDFEKLLDGQPVPKQPFQTLSGHAAAVCSVAFSPDGRFLLTGSHDNSLMVWSARNQTIDDQPLARGAVWKTLRGHSSLVRDAVYSPTDPNRAASASYDGTVRVWGIREYEESRVLAGTVLRGHADAILTANFSPTGDYVITASRDRTARSWDPRTGDHIRRFQEGHQFLVTRGVFYPDGRRLLTAAGDGTVRVWDVRTGAELFAVSGIGHTAAAALSPDGRWIVTARSGNPASRPETEAPPADSEPAVAATVWDAETGEPVRNLGGHAAPVTAVALTPNARVIFTGDAKGRGNLWDTTTGDLLHTL
ncbi:MAG: serine/threonine protein kinase, partial [Planctomycetes bacterium]|nr:serine/threonine protein kinase [Planctomycetota bacterium]